MNVLGSYMGKLKSGTNRIFLDKSKKKYILAIGTDKFVLGSTYTIYLNNERYQDFAIVDTTTTVGDNNQNFNNHININK